MFTFTHPNAKAARTVIPCLQPAAPMGGRREYPGSSSRVTSRWANPSFCTAPKGQLSRSLSVLALEADR